MGQLGLGPSEGSNVGRLDHDLAGVDWEPYGVLWMEKRVVPHHDEILKTLSQLRTSLLSPTHLFPYLRTSLPSPTHMAVPTYAHRFSYLCTSLP